MNYPVESSPLERWYYQCPHFIEEEVKVKSSSAIGKCHRTIKYQDGIVSLNPTLAFNRDHTICFRILSGRLNIFLKIQLPRDLNIDSCFTQGAKKFRDHRVYIVVIYFMACISQNIPPDGSKHCIFKTSKAKNKTTGRNGTAR